MPKLSRRARPVKPCPAEAPTAPPEDLDLDARLALIQALIPLGLEALSDVLQAQVEQLVGPRYARKDTDQPLRRWGQQRGSVYLADQKLPVAVPRVRHVATHTEVPLSAYQALQQPRDLDQALLARVLHGLSTRQYEPCAQAVPEAFGLSASTVSRRFIEATAVPLRQFQERRLEGYDLVALFLDGKTFGEEQMLMALGVTLQGDKIPLGFVQTSTENERVCRQFLASLIDRGLQYQQGLLVRIDGAKGLHSAVTQALPGYAVLQRCQWHKRENVVSHLPKSEQVSVRRRLQRAYEEATHAKARAALDRLARELEAVNVSAVRSLAEGLEETLTLQRLGLMPELKDSFRTTNCLESINSQVGQRTAHVKRWTTAAQRHRWLAAALLDIEPRLRKVNGYPFLPLLRRQLQVELKLDVVQQAA